MTRKRISYLLGSLELPCEEGEDYEGSVTELVCDSCGETIVLSPSSLGGKCTNPECNEGYSENMRELLKGIGK